jgi:hypothetical protein
LEAKQTGMLITEPSRSTFFRLQMRSPKMIVLIYV